MAEQNRKTLRSFYCRDYLWELFEVMTRDLGCSMDYLINEAMRHYARSRNYSLANASPRPGDGAPQQGFGDAGQSPDGAPSEGGFDHEQRSPSYGQAPPAARDGYASPQRPGTPPPPPPQQGYARQPTGGGFAQPQQGYGDQGQQAYPYQGEAAGNPGFERRGYPPPPPPGYGGQPPPPPMPGGDQGFAAPGVQPALYLIFNGQKYKIDKEKFIIGRGSQMTDLTIRDGNISRKHAAIIYRGGKYFVKDLDSTNGIDYQGSRIDSKKIEEGDVFHICDYELRFSFQA
jgi:hypothetical protein